MLLLRSTAVLAVVLATAGCAEAEPPTVHEVTMAAPDIVRVEVREAPVHPGKIVKLPVPRSEPRGSWIKVASGEVGTLIGPKRDHLRTVDRADLVRLDRATVDRASGYGPLGERRVVAVYRKSVPWSSGSVASGRTSMPVASFRHFIYLKLDAPLKSGRYTVQWPHSLLPTTTFTFDDKVTRSSSIRANQVGHRADDVSKYAYLVLWLPNGPEDGAVDFRRYGLNDFHVINARGEVVLTGPIALRLGPKEPEKDHGEAGALKTYTRADGSKYPANRTGTYVFGLDYSALRDMPPGRYRLQIAGLGTSDPFDIADDVWFRAARAAMAGLYHQRSGMALDGRFGYTRPECYTEATGVKVLQSKLPLVLSNRSPFGPIKFHDGAKAPWITDEIVSNASGGYHDAGDWERVILHATNVSYLLLDVFEMLPKKNRDMKFGTPATGEVLNDPIYRGKDLPGLVDEALWNLDFFRRLQRPDGAVRGGIDSGGGPLPGEPCWLESQKIFAFAPDLDSTFAYAGVAAKLAIVLGDIGESELAALYRDSALRAWEWAEQGLSKPDTVYGEARRLAGLSSADFEKRLKPILQTARDTRLFAAGVLYRLTGEERFNQATLERLRGWIAMSNVRADAAWEYANATWPSADRKVQQSTMGLMIELTRRNVTKVQLHGRVAYRTMQSAAVGLEWGGGLGLYNAKDLIRAHKLTNDPEFLAIMQDGSAFVLGANQIGKSFTTGLGQRWPFAPLHVNSIVAGVPPPTGITIYGWTSPGTTGMYWWAWASYGPLSEDVPERRVEPAPARTAFPYFEFLIEYPWLVISAEFTIHQTIAPAVAVWTYLHGYQRDAVAR